MKFGIALLASLLVSSLAFAATGNVTKELRRGNSYSVKGRNCTLSLVRERSSQIIIRCGGDPASTAQRASVTIRRGKRATIKARSCFLAITSRSDARIGVKCFRVQPTATPTVTPTATATATPTLTPNAQALAANNVIVSFNTSNPANSASVQAVTGVTAPQTLVSIDRRPQNGGLYGLGYDPTTGSVQLYLISVAGGVANPVGSTGSFVDGSSNPVRIGVDELTKIGIDFNPTVDRIRVVTTSGQNFRMNPNTGAFVDGNLGGGVVAGTNTDGAQNGPTTTVGETAYTNNAAGSTVTTQYTLDATTDALYIQNAPNSGTQTNPLQLTQNSALLSTVEIRGFDIPSGVNTSSSNTAVSSGSGFAIIEYASTSQQRFASVDLTNGAVSNDSLIGDGTSELLGLALQSATAYEMVALGSDGVLYKFSSATPESVTPATLTGMVSGETMIGIDYRPATGQLFGLGVDAGADTATLYLVDPQTGAATVVGTPSTITNGDLPSASTGYGFNFNPTVDRIRIVTGSGLNFRLNPSTGALAAADVALNGAATGAQATSYSNSFAGTTLTTQYTINAGADQLLIQNPPNNGTLTAVGGLGFDIAASAGLEIPSSVVTTSSGSGVTSGSAFAVFTVAGVTGLYTVDLTSGAATLVGTVGAGTTPMIGLAVSERLAR